MKNALFIASLFALAACGLSEDKFAEEFATKVCDAYHECDESIDCEAGSTTDTSEAAVECEFDKDAAKACLDGVYACDDSAGFPLVELPSDCLNVYDCSATGTTSTGTTMTGTTMTGTSTTTTTP